MKTKGRRHERRFTIELSDEEYEMMKLISDAEGESAATIVRRLVRFEYRFMVEKGYLDAPIIPKAPKERK